MTYLWALPRDSCVFFVWHSASLVAATRREHMDYFFLFGGESHALTCGIKFQFIWKIYQILIQCWLPSIIIISCIQCIKHIFLLHLCADVSVDAATREKYVYVCSEHTFDFDELPSQSRSSRNMPFLDQSPQIIFVENWLASLAVARRNCSPASLVRELWS